MINFLVGIANSRGRIAAYFRLRRLRVLKEFLGLYSGLGRSLKIIDVGGQDLFLGTDGDG